MNIKLKIKNLSCVDCSKDIIIYAKKIFNDVNLNFSTGILSLNTNYDFKTSNYNIDNLISYIKKIDSNIIVENLTYNTLNLKIEGLTCFDCANKIDEKLNENPYILFTKLNFATSNYKIYYLKNKINILDIKKIINNIEEEVTIIDLDNTIKNEDWKNKKNIKLLRIIWSLLLFLLAYIIKDLKFVLFITSYIIISYDIIIAAFSNKLLDEKFLMTIATLAAIYIQEFPEAIMVMLLFQIGEILQSMAINKSRQSISNLIDIQPEYANLVLKNEIVKASPDKIMPGDIIVIKPGEKIPLDGIILEGISYINTSNITGESLPVKVKEGDTVLSGTINNDGLLKVKVLKEYKDSTVNTILNLLESSSENNADLESMITRISKKYTPIVTIIAFLIVLIPFILNKDLTPWIYKSAVFLVMSCPCALVISLPLTYFSGLGKASKDGVLIKGDIFLEKLSKVDAILLDKTGTITEGTFSIVDNKFYTNDDVLKLAASLETYSNHPIAKSIIKSYKGKKLENNFSNIKEIPGKGISGTLNNNIIYVGNKDFLLENNIKIINDKLLKGTYVYIGKNNKHIGTLVLNDKLKPNIKKHINELKYFNNIKEIAVVSGDKDDIVKDLSNQLNINSYYSELLPQDKVTILNNYKNKYKNVLFLGDGVNDGPVLQKADIGVSIGDIGSDIAIESSDVVIMGNDLTGLIKSMNIAKKTSIILKQNLLLVAFVKLFVLILGILGYSTMWQAVFADTGITIITILNSIRILK